MSFIKAETNIPYRSLVVGNPATVIKEVSDELREWKTKGKKMHQKLQDECH